MKYTLKDLTTKAKMTDIQAINFLNNEANRAIALGRKVVRIYKGSKVAGRLVEVRVNDEYYGVM